MVRSVPNNPSVRFIYVKPDRSVFFPSVEYMKIKINKAIPSKKSAATIDGVLFQESRDLGDIATTNANNANGAINTNGAANGVANRSVAVSYSTTTIPQSLSDSKLTANASGIDSSKTNIIDVESSKLANGMNGSSNANKKMMLNGKQRSNTIANGLQPNDNASNELIAGEFLI